MINQFRYFTFNHMNVDDFKKLIRKNSREGRKTEFIRFTLSIDDYRMSVPPDFGVEERFFVEYDREHRTYKIYFPDKEQELRLNTHEVDDVFYSRAWGTCIHR